MWRHVWLTLHITFLHRSRARIVMMLPGRPHTRNITQHVKAEFSIQSG